MDDAVKCLKLADAKLTLRAMLSGKYMPKVCSLLALSCLALTGVSMACAQSPEASVVRLSQADAVKAFQQFLEAETAEGEFSGAALVAKNGQVLFSAAYGLANREGALPNTVETQFRLGSMNKIFTAVGVLQLVQAESVQLEDTVGTYITDYPNQEVADKVTIHHLLTHTGGTGNFFGSEYDAQKKEMRTLDDYLMLLGERGLRFEPGERWEYSNYGFILLGLVIERVTGQSYFDYIRQHVYEPAGMRSSASYTLDDAFQKGAIGYTRTEDQEELARNTDWLAYRGTSAGGGFSTVGDLLRFTQSVLGNVLLDVEHTELLLSPQVDTDWGHYTYGLVDRRGKDENGWVGHGGSAPGMNTELRIFPESGYVVIVLANLDRPAAIVPTYFLQQRLPLL